MKKLFFAIATLTAFSFGTAQSTVDMSHLSIEDILSSSDQVSIFDAMVEFAALEDVLDLQGPFTVFAPVDRAWVGLSSATINHLIRNPETLRSVLLHHMVWGEGDLDRLLRLLIADANERIGDEAALETEVEDVVESLLATGVPSAIALESVQQTRLEISAVPSTDSTADDSTGETSAQIPEDDQFMGIAEQVIALRAEGIDLRVNDAKIVSVDIRASNGVIHLIDSVLVPEDVELPR